jgi:hypothetical protein
MLENVKKFNQERKDKKDLEKRVMVLEKAMNHLQMELDIAMDARVTYLEAKIVDIKKMKPIVDEMHKQIHTIYDSILPKKDLNKQHEKSGMEVA